MLIEPIRNSEKSEPQMGFEPTTFHDLVGSRRGGGRVIQEGVGFAGERVIQVQVVQELMKINKFKIY